MTNFWCNSWRSIIDVVEILSDFDCLTKRIESKNFDKIDHSYGTVAWKPPDVTNQPKRKGINSLCPDKMRHFSFLLDLFLTKNVDVREPWSETRKHLANLFMFQCSVVNHTMAESFYNSNYGPSIITSKVRQIISVMKTKRLIWYFKNISFWHFNSCFVVKTTKHQCLCFHCWDYFTNFWHNNWRSIINVVERLSYWTQTFEILGSNLVSKFI